MFRYAQEGTLDIVEGDDMSGLGRGSVRDSRVQPVDSGCVEKRHRLGEPALREECVHEEAISRDRDVAWQDWHGGGPAASAQYSRLLQFAADERHRAYIQFEPGLITPNGEVTKPEVESFLRGYMTEFHAFITRVYTVLPRPT